MSRPQKVEMLLLDPEHPEAEPRKIAEFEATVLPGQGERIVWKNRVFAVLARGWAMEDVLNAAGPTQVMDVGLVVQQIGGPPMLVTTPSPLIIPGRTQ